MTELRITRSRDIELYINGEQLFGVTDFYARCESDSYPIREYLSGEPYALVNERYEYTIKLNVLSLFRFAVMDTDGFTLSAEDDDVIYSYDGCTIVRHEHSVHAGKNVVDEFLIKAKSMRKQALTHDG